MSGRTSLRSRLVIGILLWTAGLFAVAGLVVTVVSERHPDAMVLVHRSFSHFSVVGLAAGVLLLGALALVLRGVSPVNQLRRRLQAVREGQDETIAGTYPSEVQPLVDDLNALLDHRGAAVRRAMSRAGDLAHGLKTPLAVLAHEADRARGDGHDELAERLEEQIVRMRRQVDYHLAQARAAASGAAPGTRCLVRTSAEALARTLERLHVARGVSVALDVAATHAVRVQREDLDEMLGNLLDNACKWTRSQVALTSELQDGRVVIDVDDNGEGLAPDRRDEVLQRGTRADEAAPGSGLGLAIVRELATLYGGSIRLMDSPLGGLRARLELPASQSE